MTAAVERILKASGALLEGRFLLSSGLPLSLTCQPDKCPLLLPKPPSDQAGRRVADSAQLVVHS